MFVFCSVKRGLLATFSLLQYLPETVINFGMQLLPVNLDPSYISYQESLLRLCIPVDRFLFFDVAVCSARFVACSVRRIISVSPMHAALLKIK